MPKPAGAGGVVSQPQMQPYSGLSHGHVPMAGVPHGGGPGGAPHGNVHSAPYFANIGPAYGMSHNRPY
eukprot:gene23168-biopygen8466